MFEISTRKIKELNKTISDVQRKKNYFQQSRENTHQCQKIIETILYYMPIESYTGKFLRNTTPEINTMFTQRALVFQLNRNHV